MKKTIKTKARNLAVSVVEKSYDKDFYKWTMSQASLLKKAEFEKLDIVHLVEEIESLGRSEKRALRSYLANLVLHLLKIKYQPGKHTKSWDLSVRNSQNEVKILLKENPSLKAQLATILDEAYFTGRLSAIAETGLPEDVFPEECPWDIKKILEKK